MANSKDHHIYIHYEKDGSGAGFKRTTPSLKESKTKKTNIDIDSELRKFGSKVQNIMSTAKNPVGKAIDKLTNSVPLVATIISAVQVVDSLVETGIDIYGSYTGDINGSYGFRNFKHALQNILDPASAGLGAWKTYLNYQATSMQASQSTYLSANTINNIKTNIGGRKV